MFVRLWSQWTGGSAVLAMLCCGDPTMLPPRGRTHLQYLHLKTLRILHHRHIDQTSVNPHMIHLGSIWSSPAVLCGTPPSVENAHLIGRRRSHYDIHAVVRYQCSEGFFQRHIPTARCRADGTWERPRIICTKCECLCDSALPRSEELSFLKPVSGSADSSFSWFLPLTDQVSTLHHSLARRSHRYRRHHRNQHHERRGHRRHGGEGHKAREDAHSYYWTK